MKPTKIFILLVTLLGGTCSIANNIQVSNITLTGQNTSNHTVQIQFTVSWENSWRVTAGPANWDAAWVFVKYRVGGGSWLHATLNTSGHFEPSGCTISTGLLTPAAAFNATTNPGMGAFIYRSSNGSGTFVATNAQLQWNYNANGLGDNDVVDIQVFAIEQVYIPQGAFAAGDGLSDANQFTVTTINTANSTTAPSGSGSLGGQAGGYPTGQAAPFNATWPNGYAAFYSMKYEISQQGYVDFLNTLTRAQQASRVATNIASGVTNVTNRFVMSNSTTMNTRNGIRCDASIQSTAPVTFYCDYDGDGTGGEANDGKDIACNVIAWGDVAAYLDWAGLRPLTEIEYEKCGRGQLLPAAGEYAWGNTFIVSATSIVNAGTSSETPNSGSNAIGNGTTGPLRVGSVASSGTNRQQAGAGYYGIMELSGNLWERTITIGNNLGRAYQGTHGNGLLDASGVHTNTDWPSAVTANGLGFHGGAWNQTNTDLRLSDRTTAINVLDDRLTNAGGRGCRTAP